MATPEEIHLAHQVMTELERVRYNIRANTLSYQSRIGATPAATLGAEMKADAQQFQRRLERLRLKVDTQAIRTKVLAGLAVFGVDATALRAEYVLMNGVCSQVRSATLNNNTQITNACNQILSALPAHDTLLDEPLPVVP
jgi:hypothetical protein